MWNLEFWKATLERMVRGAAAALIAVFFVGDIVFDALSASTWQQAGAIALGGAFSSLLFSLVGNAATGNGPAITRNETLT